MSGQLFEQATEVVAVMTGHHAHTWTPTVRQVQGSYLQARNGGVRDSHGRTS